MCKLMLSINELIILPRILNSPLGDRSVKEEVIIFCKDMPFVGLVSADFVADHIESGCSYTNESISQEPDGIQCRYVSCRNIQKLFEVVVYCI